MARNPNRSRRRRQGSGDRSGPAAPGESVGRGRRELEPDAEAERLDERYVEPAPDELETESNGATRAADEAESQPLAAGGGRGGAILFLRNCAEELRRVQWPDRRQTGQATAVVLGFTLIAGAFLGAMDALWKPIIEAIL